MISETIIKMYKLPKALANEIVAEETQRTLRTRWQAWILLFSTLTLLVWLKYFGPIEFRPGAIWVVIGGVGLWHMVGRHYATPDIHKAAKAKAHRLAGKYAQLFVQADTDS